MSRSKLLVYLLRRDLRVADNPILHHLATASEHGFTHLLPVYIFPAHQIEISGFLKDGESSPYPPAKSQVANYWRCGPHRAKFIAEAVWNMRSNLETLGSGLKIRVGNPPDVLQDLLQKFKDSSFAVGGVWMTEELSWEEIQEQKALASLCSAQNVDFKIWKDEKYFVDDRDTGLAGPKDLPDVFTTYRKGQEPLREKPRKVLPQPAKSSLPTLPPDSSIPPQSDPFVSPSTLDDALERLNRPLGDILANCPSLPDQFQSGHGMSGGEVAAWERLRSLAQSGALSAYKDTRNGLVGTDYSTKLSSYLAMGCLTARQIHEELLSLENGTNELYKDAKGYGEGENEGTKGIRFELLWRDYMRLCTAKFGRKLFRLSGFRQDDSYDKKWKTPNKTNAAHNQDPGPEQMAKLLERFETGTTGMGLIDASQRELLLTGYTSNRARQNVASFLSKHLGIDWRYGAEWYEMLLVDYDVSSNWANWQYVAGVGNDPRGDARTFNPVKQAFDYDKDGSFVRMWLPELREIQKLENLFQVWTTDQEELEKCGLLDNVMVTDPVKRIEFNVDRKPKTNRRPFIKRGRGQQRAGRWGNSQYASGHGSGASSEATASDTAAPTSGNDDSHYTTNSGSNWRSSRSNASSPPQGGRGWHNSDPSRGRGFTQNRGYWRPPTGARGDYTGNYQGFPPPHIPRQ